MKLVPCTFKMYHQSSVNQRWTAPVYCYSCNKKIFFEAGIILFYFAVMFGKILREIIYTSWTAIDFSVMAWQVNNISLFLHSMSLYHVNLLMEVQINMNSTLENNMCWKTIPFEILNQVLVMWREICVRWAWVFKQSQIFPGAQLSDLKKSGFLKLRSV